MCWISPEAFSAKNMSGSHGVVGKSGGAWMMLSQVIWTGVFHRSFDWFPKKNLQNWKTMGKKLHVFSCGMKLSSAKVRSWVMERVVYMKLKLKEIRWRSDKWKVHEYIINVFCFSIQSKNGDFWNCFVGELFLCQNKRNSTTLHGAFTVKTLGLKIQLTKCTLLSSSLPFLVYIVVPFAFCLSTNLRKLHFLKQVSWLSNSSHPAAKWWVMIPPKACCKWCRRRSKTPLRKQNSRFFEGINIKLSAKRLTLDT